MLKYKHTKVESAKCNGFVYRLVIMPTLLSEIEHYEARILLLIEEKGCWNSSFAGKNIWWTRFMD